ncbi:MAG: N-acetylmuramoyl-L-alanine amidase [Anaerolineales bacterium]|nr:N-acetylmuramoyl-L-alanine amidase [Anaerolineales bacterium]
MYKNLKTISFLALLTLLVAVSWPKTESTAAAPIMQSLIWQGEDFAQGSGADTAVSPTGLTLANEAMTAVYTSDSIHTPIGFNALVTSWAADVPADSSLDIQVRTRKGAGDWSEWFHLETHIDLVDEEDHENLSDMITVPDVNGTHDTIQFSVSLGRFDTAVSPQLHSIDFTFIDTTAGPTTEELLARQAAVDAANGSKPSGTGYPRPTVISRDVWCTSVDCDYTAGLAYDDASHMIVHHTVSSNTSSNWAAVVRAIWAFHTYPTSATCSSCRGWGDIGYNYLIDQNGIIYEGHMNEDYLNLDVVGTHASGANTGSMGVSLIGTFTGPDYPSLPGIAPPTAMKNSLIELLSWKADQRGINVYESDPTMPYVEGGRPNLMGHRDVYGTTECPGDQVHDLLPWLRDQVAANIGTVDNHIYVNEDSAQFTKSAANWYVGSNECGHNLHSFYTYSTTNPANSTNWGTWRPNVPEDGRYLIQMYVPYCSTGKSETDGATYEVHHADGVTTVVASQQANLGQWLTLGEFNLTAGTSNYVYLDDLTTTDSGLGLWFDGMRLLKLAPPPDTVSATAPTAGTWLNDPQVDFTWEIYTTTSQVLTTSFTVSTDAAQTNMLDAQTWNTAVLSHTYNFATEQPTLYWQATAVVSPTEAVTETISTPLIQFGLDMTAPTASIDTFYELPNGDFMLKWSGSDALSGIADYTLEYRAQGTTDWTTWLSHTTALQTFFTPPNPAEIYEIRLVPTDVAGNRPPTDAPPSTSTEQAIPLPHAIMLPIITNTQGTVLGNHQ